MKLFDFGMDLFCPTESRGRLVKGLGVALALLVLGTTPAYGMVGNSDEAFGLDGSLRTLLLGSRGFSVVGRTYEGLGQGSLRLIAGGSPEDWWSYEVHGVSDVAIRSASFSRVHRPEQGRLRHRSVDTLHRWVDEADERSDVEGSLFVDRATVTIRREAFDLTVGRQAISFGTAYFWNPLDVFRPFGATQFDRDYKSGVDALRVDIPTDAFSGITVAASPGRGTEEERWDRSTGVVRWFTTLDGWDATVQAGKVLGGYQMGGGVSGDWNGLGLRSELALFKPLEGDSMPQHMTAVVGLGRRLANDLSVEVEYLYNGAAETPGLKNNVSERAELVGKGRLLHRSGHLVGGMGRCELTPILNATVSALYSISDESMMVQPGLHLSVSDESDILLGGMFTRGHADTEFGGFPSVLYMQMKSYF
ncbi:MAG: hypothetical protein VX699_01785 [Myxococcota bacterium]|nr:hypothetical protein [Myxococcota bacterium]